MKKIARSITPRDQKKIEHFFEKEKREKDVDLPMSAKRKRNCTEKEIKNSKTPKKEEREGSTHCAYVQNLEV